MKARSFAVAGFASLLTLPAFAAVTPDHLLEEASLEVGSGLPARVARRTTWQVPFSSARAWERLVEEVGPSWRGLWDADTGVPLRLFGAGLPVPGSVASEDRALAHARAFLARHAGLLAPGASPSDFELVANELDRGMRTVAFEQHHQGLPVFGGQLSFSFKKDRLFVVGSEAVPNVAIDMAGRKLAEPEAVKAASTWIAESFGSKTSLRAIEGEGILPIVRSDGTTTLHHVLRVVVDARDPIGRWAVYLDRATGARVAREQLLKFQAPEHRGTLRYNAPERHPGATRLDHPARGVSVVVAGQQAETDDLGQIAWSGTSTPSVRASVVGPLVRVINDAGPEAAVSFDLVPGGSYVWDVRDDEFADAQLNTYVASQIAKDKARAIAPDMRWLDTQLQATVNLGQSCNAFADGTTINFFRASNRCENTARLPDVVYHEFGHTFHAHAIIRGVGRFDSALSEGASDFLAAIITEDPGMGRGFFYSNQPLRHIDPPNGEARWPEDVGESHTTGLIYAGAMWDLRKALIATLGEEAGRRQTDDLFYQSLRRSADIPSSYVEVLAADDDDGDLANGTPNFCDIVHAFAAHGLADPGAAGTGIQAPTTTDFSVSLPVSQSFDCPGMAVRSAALEWRLRGDPNVSGTVPMTQYHRGYEVLIPEQPAGQVVQYRVIVELMNGEERSFPDNPADPYYELFVGDVVPLYCTDFESNPEHEGWTHELLRGTDREGADDWQWGEPAGTPGSGDPDHAYSGTRVVGNDLGGGRYNGTYQPNKTNVMHAPSIDVQGFENVRLQYRRWLNVENGFYDQASIVANGTIVWTNLDSGERDRTHHEDREWRFHDVDLSGTVRDGRVQISFVLSSDGGLEFGGWTIDDFCIVGYAAEPAGMCGDGKVDPGEACDDGNQIDGDGCNSDCTPSEQGALCGNGVLDPGEACDPGIDAAGCTATCTPAGGASAQPDGELGLVEPKEGCGCAAARGRSQDGWLIGLGLLGLVALRRLRRQRRA